jgi:hypothetical protein
MSSNSGSSIAAAADGVAKTAASLARWVVNPANEPMVGAHTAELVRALRREAMHARQLRRGAIRKMAVGFFGPSQAGKSYLVSHLARKPGAAFALKIGDRTYDFLTEINPPGNRESTGLVTRFSMDPAPGTPDLPVRLRLLTQMDLVKILGNSFLQDFDPNAATSRPLKEDMIVNRLGELRKLAAAQPVDTLTEDDVYEISEYFSGNFLNQTAHLQVGFWDEAMAIAPKLDLPHRARLWSIIWSDFEPFTKLWLELQGGLQQLKFASEANLSIDALIPRETSIIDVLTLDKLGTDSNDLLQVQPNAEAGPVGSPMRLPRSLICALAAELVTSLPERPWPFLDSADLLDFPGARSRLRISSLEDVKRSKGVAEGANPLRELLLRGKVAYLFERYTVERELAALALCIPDGPQEVRDLSDMVGAWVRQVVGATREARARQSRALLLVLTKMDREFEVKSGETDQSRKSRWTSRLNNSLLNNFRGEWPHDWDGNPFNNTFWLRNPEHLEPGRIVYVKGAEPPVETAFTEEFTQQLAMMREFFLGNDDVKRHFAQPMRAWDEAMKLNDGGVTYLIGALAPLCDARTKLEQDAQALDAVRQSLHQLMGRFYVSSDADKRIEQRLQAVNAVFDQLYQEKAKLGLLLRGLQLDFVDLREHFHRTLVRGTSESAQEANKADAPPPPPPTIRQLQRPGAPPAAPAPQQAAPAPTSRSPWAAQAASAALALWDKVMNDTIENERFCKRVGVDNTALRTIVAELLISARRVRIDKLIEAQIDAVLHLDADLGVGKAAIVSQHFINRFVSELGMDRLPPGDRPVIDGSDVPVFAPRAARQSIEGWPAERPAFEPDYLVSWAYAFNAIVTDNAKAAAGLKYNVDENNRLGQLLGDLAQKAEA